jgi:hypothetical protein
MALFNSEIQVIGPALDQQDRMLAGRGFQCQKSVICV